MRHSTTAILTAATLLFALSSAALAQPDRPPVSFTKQAGDLSTVKRQELPPLDNAELLAEAKRLESEEVAAPYRFAEPRAAEIDLVRSATRETLADGSQLWRLRLASPGALHLNLGFSRFDLPEGASAWIYNPAGDYVEGPFTARHRSERGRLFTPIVVGSEIVVELHVPAGAGGGLDVRLGQVNHGFRGFTKGFSGSCNNDVICPEGDPWRDQIRSVARYTIGGSTLCTGQLVNNTALDDTPYFLSAFHCSVNAGNADTLVFYWNYESPVCGMRGGGSLQDNQSGAVFRASEETTDFLLVELSEPPDPAYDVFYTGWDVSGETPQSSVGIHHPSGDVKAISFNDDPLGMGQWIDPDTHWVVDNWEDGTTEGGSSGSCLWDPDTQLCVGVLTAGVASCTVIGLDIYGKLFLAWDIGATPSTRLRDWLDPQGLGIQQLQGQNPGESGLSLRGNRFLVEVNRTGAQGPGPARAVPVGNDESAIFWFFSPDNWEMLIKVLDGCDINNNYWVFAASATDVEWTITVTDTDTGEIQEYTHAAGSPSPAVTDTSAFATCP